MRFKSMQKVRVRTDLRALQIGTNVVATQDMIDLEGKEVTIACMAYEKIYEIEEDNSWLWHEKMLEAID